MLPGNSLCLSYRSKQFLNVNYRLSVKWGFIKLFLYEMFVIQFFHDSLQKTHLHLYRYGYHHRS